MKMRIGSFRILLPAGKRARLRCLVESHFDPHFYLRAYPENAAAGFDAVDHFVTYGWKEGRHPRSDFDPDFYLRSNPDLPPGTNPFAHYIQFGIAEKRTPASPRENNSDAITEAFDTEVEGLKAVAQGHKAEVEGLQAEVQGLKAEVQGLKAEVGRLHNNIEAADAIAARRNAEMDAILSRQNADLHATKVTVGAHDGTLMQSEQQRREREQFISHLETLVTGLLTASREHVKNGLLVSIIMPTRDRASHLSEAIDSVLGQLYEDWELIVVDDASTDGATTEIVSRCRDARVRYTRLASASGAAAARNIGLKLASGEIIAYLDDDNLWFPEYLTGVVAAYVADPTLQSAYGIMVREPPEAGQTRLLWRPFERALLLKSNYIDLNCFTHPEGWSNDSAGSMNPCRG